MKHYFRSDVTGKIRFLSCDLEFHFVVYLNFHNFYIYSLGALGQYNSNGLDNVLSITKSGLYLCTTSTVNRPSDNYMFIMANKISSDIFILNAYGNDGQLFFNGVIRKDNPSTPIVWRRVYDNSILTDQSVLSPLATALGGLLHVTTGSIPQNTEVTLPLGCGLLMIGIFSAAALYWIPYWTSDIVTMQTTVSGGLTVTKDAGTRNVKVTQNITNELMYVFVGFSS